MGKIDKSYFCGVLFQRLKFPIGNLLPLYNCQNEEGNNFDILHFFEYTG